MNSKKSKFDLNVDVSLIHEAQQGNLTAHESLFKLFSRPTFNLALRFCNQREIAEDILQDTFVKVLKNIRTFKCEAPFGMWLRQIAVNEALMHLRHKRLLPDLLNEDISDTLSNVIDFGYLHGEHDQEANNVQVHATLERVLAQLPAQTRVALWLKEVEGYSHKEIAQLMGKSESFSKSLVARAFKRLKLCYSDNEKNIVKMVNE